VLEPGGFLYLAESHPCALCLDEIEGRLVPHYNWRTASDAPIVTDEAKTYTGDARPITRTRNYQWIHPLSDIVAALQQAGLSLDWLHEHELLTYRLFPMMKPVESGRVFCLPDGQPRLALSFSLKATKR
jgi:hypothetical protein